MTSKWRQNCVIQGGMITTTNFSLHYKFSVSWTARKLKILLQNFRRLITVSSKVGVYRSCKDGLKTIPCWSSTLMSLPISCFILNINLKEIFTTTYCSLIWVSFPHSSLQIDISFLPNACTSEWYHRGFIYVIQQHFFVLCKEDIYTVLKTSNLQNQVSCDFLVFTHEISCHRYSFGTLFAPCSNFLESWNDCYCLPVKFQYISGGRVSNAKDCMTRSYLVSTPQQILFEWWNQGGWYVRSLWHVRGRKVHAVHWFAGVKERDRAWKAVVNGRIM